MTPTLSFLLLGAFHGINPAMGWLFAVALGMQERRRAAVWRALLPLGLGHALAVAAVILLALLLGAMLPMRLLKWMVAAVLIGLGIFYLARHWHPRYGGMRVGFRQLTIWSFLMASAHGAGMMVLPFFLGGSASPLAGLSAIVLHTVGYLLVAALVAALVYEKLGVGVIRKAWFNIDLIWAGALFATGLLTLLL